MFIFFFLELFSSKKSKKEEKEKEKGKEEIKTKKIEMVDTNSILFDIDALTEEIELNTGEPIKCKHCNSILSQFSKISRLKNQEDEADWKCEFCDKINKSITIYPEEFPQKDVVEYLLETSNQENEQIDEFILFALDISGSMTVIFLFIY